MIQKHKNKGLFEDAGFQEHYSSTTNKSEQKTSMGGIEPTNKWFKYKGLLRPSHLRLQLSF